MEEEENSSFGAFLKAQREMRGVKLQALSEVTRVPLKSLVSLEEDRREDLPAKVFVLGFIRAYAREIGLDAEETVLRYEQSLGEHRTPEAHVSGESSDRRDKLILAAILLALGAAATLLIYFLVLEGRSVTPPETAPKATPTARAKASPKSAGTPAATRPASTPTAKPEATAAPTKAAAVPTQTPAAPTPAPTVRAEAAPTPPPRTAPTPKPTPVSDGEPQEATVTVTDTCWVMFEPQGEEKRDYILKAGESKTVRFQGRIRIEVGNAAAATVRFDGRVLKNLGPPGRPVTLTLPRETPPGNPQE